MESTFSTSLPLLESGGGLCGPPQVHNTLLCFGGVQEQVVVRAALGHMLERLLVTGLAVVANESHHRRVISSCYQDVGGRCPSPNRYLVLNCWAHC